METQDRRRNLDDAERIVSLCRLNVSPKDVFDLADAVREYIETGKPPVLSGVLLNRAQREK